MKKHGIPISTREVAVIIANDMFRNGNNEVASRLVLELVGGGDGGGWSKGAFIDQVKSTLDSLIAEYELQ